MFLDRGRSGERQLFSAAAVAAMTCNQIAGVPATYRGEFSRSLVESGLGCAGRQESAPRRLAAFQGHVRTRGRGRCVPVHQPRQRSHPGLFFGPDPPRTTGWLTTVAG